MNAEKTDTRLGRTLKIDPVAHAGHTVTVEKRDIEKHKAYWLRCECGAAFLLGEHWLDIYLRTGAFPLYRESATW